MQCLPSIPNSNTRDKAQSTRHRRSPVAALVADVIATEAPGGGREAPSDFIQADGQRAHVCQKTQNQPTLHADRMRLTLTSKVLVQVSTRKLRDDEVFLVNLY